MPLADQLDLEGLRSFVAVVDHGGFRTAASALFLAQSVVTRRIQQLERALGVRLLERGPWGVRPTSQGEALLPAARRLLDDAAELVAETRGAGERTLRLGVTPAVAGFVLAPFLAEWMPRHPRVRVVALEDGVVGLRDRLAQRECDLAFLAAPLPEFTGRRFMRTVTVMAYIPPRHPLAVAPGEPLAVSGLHREPVLVSGPPFMNYALFHSACTLMRAQPEIVYSSAVAETLAALAAAGLGIGVTGDLMAYESYDVVARPLCGPDAVPLTFDLHLAWDRRRPLAPTSAAFVDGIADFTRRAWSSRPGASR